MIINGTQTTDGRDLSSKTSAPRIAVIGATGAGKTTLSKAIAERLNLDLIHLDALCWEKEWTRVAPDVFRQRAVEALSGEAWVADGYYRVVRDIVWKRANMVVWLDYTPQLIIRQLIRRQVSNIQQPKVLWNGNRTRGWEQFYSREALHLWSTRIKRLIRSLREQKQFRSLLHKDFVNLNVVRLRSPQEADTWLQTLRRDQSMESGLELSLAGSQGAKQLVLELVGPAGAGKSHLLQALKPHTNHFSVIHGIPRLVRVPLFLMHFVRLMPVMLKLLQCRVILPWERLKDAVFINAFLHLIRREQARGSEVVILDEGPVYRLTRVLRFFLEAKAQGIYFQHFESHIQQWAQELDFLVWMDATDATLIQRIRNREKEHRMKRASDQEIIRFLSSYRIAYQELIASFTTIRPCLISIDTTQKPVQQELNTLLAVLKNCNFKDKNNPLQEIYESG